MKNVCPNSACFCLSESQNTHDLSDVPLPDEKTVILAGKRILLLFFSVSRVTESTVRSISATYFLMENTTDQGCIIVFTCLRCRESIITKSQLFPRLFVLAAIRWGLLKTSFVYVMILRYRLYATEKIVHRSIKHCGSLISFIDNHDSIVKFLFLFSFTSLFIT